MLIDELEMAGADVHFPRHIGNAPGILGVGGNFPAQRQQRMVMDRVLCIEQFIAELIKKNPEELGNDGGSIQRAGFLQVGMLCQHDIAGIVLKPAGAGKLRGFPGQKLKQIVKVFRIRNGERNRRLRKSGNIGFIRSEIEPVVPVGLPGGPIPDGVIGRI